MQDPTAFFKVILPCGWLLSKKDEFNTLADLVAARSTLTSAVPVQRGRQWYAAHFEAAGFPEVTDQFTAWVNQTAIRVWNYGDKKKVASAMVAEIAMHFGITGETTELMCLVWDIVVRGQEYIKQMGHEPTDGKAFLDGLAA